MKKVAEKQKPKRGARRTTKRKSRVRQQSTLEIMERLLTSPVLITVGGTATRVTALEAIILQVMQKAMAGNGRAFRMLADYQELASKRAGGPAPLRFVENDYARMVTKDLSRND
jgi:molybdopterin biosynthesis enzyme MoaB